jgi:predicted N-acetyltransferase YhbS
MPDSDVTYELNPPLTNEALNALYGSSWPNHTSFDFQPVLSHALAYIGAYLGETLVGFVYVAWDGSQHAFLLEPTVHPDVRHRGIGRELVRLAASTARKAGCEWLHVDYEPQLAPFYEACGFSHTEAGLIRLRGP